MSDVDDLFVDIQNTGPRDIPRAKFVENISAEFDTLEKCRKAKEALSVLLAKYSFMEKSLYTHRMKFESQLPDIKKAIEVLSTLTVKKEKQQQVVYYPLSQTCFAKAKVDMGPAVYLWLGANVMMEYSLPEALEILTTNCEQAEEVVEELKQSLDFLRIQITTSELNLSRVHNRGVELS